jgi:MFS family permease
MPLGLVLMAFAETPFVIMLGGGILMGLGIAMTSFAVVMAAFGRLVPPEKRSWSFGIATAASSMGQFVFAPIGHAFIAAYGWQAALLLLAGICLLMILFALPLGASKGGVARGEVEVEMALGKPSAAPSATRASCFWCSDSSCAGFRWHSSPCTCRPIWWSAA